MFGSGPRSGSADTGHVPGRVTFNTGPMRDFAGIDGEPMTFRFDAVNVAGRVDELRDGSGTGVFAPHTASGAASSRAWRSGSAPR